MKIYLAGPEVFLPDAKDVLRLKADMARGYGFEPLAPGDNQIETSGTRREMGYKINGFDEALMDAADGIIANLTPFRGPGADPGTCYEVGYMCAKGKAAFAYTNDARTYFERVSDLNDGKLSDASEGRFFDAEGLAVENFDMAENLMLVGGIERRGGKVITHAAAADARYTDLAAFEECLRLMAQAHL
ncbi:nucleoside 2-deoxyribosyltransferase [Rhizobium sp. L1K21]|uniref:nucleoside 2-deoxyribosyltransferase n=1 Tax=Rhizobium sp. L1K21 TaxID=2954933 RepID=UPI002091FCB3|nr:nucleoside 2-deoxyribosyltransferase [Rhizobium sp. L1K21]MCO6186336.1 nucleoside 2-deoxyribosyltransferase [Rhizobium sp. L1K21]